MSIVVVEQSIPNRHTTLRMYVHMNIKIGVNVRHYRIRVLESFDAALVENTIPRWTLF